MSSEESLSEDDKLAAALHGYSPRQPDRRSKLGVPHDRAKAAFAHLGVPCWAIFTPLVLWATAGRGSFTRMHARQAFAFQCIVLAGHLFNTATMTPGRFPARVFAWLGFALALEIPQVIRALRGLPPYRLIPLQLPE
ncbi:MAG: hypothetical protein ACKV2O_09410 [Acidimicrobiales bacterium]